MRFDLNSPISIEGTPENLKNDIFEPECFFEKQLCDRLCEERVECRCSVAPKVAKSRESLLTVMNRTLTKSDSCDMSVMWGEGGGREMMKAALNLLEYMASTSVKTWGNWPWSTEEISAQKM